LPEETTGVAFRPELEREIPEAPWVEGKDLATAIALLGLDEIPERLGLEPLSAFTVLDETRPAPPSWFPASEGLKTVRGLLDYLASNPQALRDEDGLLAELDPDLDVEEIRDGAIYHLEAIEKVLKMADEQGIRFQFRFSA